MTKTSNERWSKIEETQAALRDSIEEARELASQSERLIRKQRPEAEPGPDDSPR